MLLPKVLRAGLDLIFRRDSPIFVSHYINFKCNLSCSYCGTWKEKPKELSTGKIKGMITEFSRAGTLSWNISGGEPLLRQDIGEIVDFAKQRGLLVSINTNGTLLAQRIGEISKADLISVSIDGGEKLHDSIRGKGVFKKAVFGIIASKNAGVKTSIMAVISPMTLAGNCREIRGIIALAKSLGVQLAFQPMHGDRYNKLSKEADYFPAVFSNPNYTKAIRIIESEKRKNPQFIRMSEGYIEKLKSTAEHPCLAGRNFCIIMPDGRIAPCFVKAGANSFPSPTVSNFKRLRKYPKCFCHFNCYSEWNGLLSMRPRNLIHYLSNYLFANSGKTA